MRRNDILWFLLGVLLGSVGGASIYWLIRRNKDLDELGDFVDVDDEFEELFKGGFPEPGDEEEDI